MLDIMLKLKGLIIIIFINILFCVELNGQSGCANADFSYNNFTNWTGYTGSFINCCPVQGIVNGRHTIINTPGTDPRTGNQLQMLPPGGTHSAKLGNEQTGAQAERLRYTLTVTPQNALFIYKYAVVFQDPNHTSSDQPKFNIRVLNASGNVLDPVCGFYSVVSSGSIPGFQTAPGTVRWKNWTNVGIDLSPYMGQNITIEYTTYDCAQGGHYGYAYISCSCAPMEISMGYCQGNATVDMQAPDGFVSYLWSPGGQTTQSITITNPVVGTNYSCLLTSHNGCQVTLNAVLVPTIVSANFSINSPPCSFTVNLSDASTVNQGQIDEWHWNFGDGATSTQQNPSHTYSTSGTYTVTLTAGSMGCTNTTTQTVVVSSGLNANAGPDQNICIGQSATLTATGGTAYLWSNNNTSASITVSPLLTTTYTVTVADANGCTATDAVVVNVYSEPTVDAGQNASICAGSDVNLNATGGVTYTWTPPTGLSNPNIENPVASPTTTTTYTVTVVDSYGCSNTDNVIITVLNAQPADAGPDQHICNGNTATLTATGGINYVWSTGDSLSTLIVSPSVNTTYTVTVSDINGCSSSDDIVVFIVPNPIVYAGEDTYICSGSSTNLSASGGVTYIWSPSAGLSNINIPNPVASPATPSTFTVTATDAYGCSATDDVFVDVYPSPNVAFSANVLSGCEPLSVQFTDNSGQGIQSWLWNFGDNNSANNTSDQQNPVHFYENPGVYTVSLTVITIEGCTGINTIPDMINVYPNPTANFSSSASATDENPLIFFNDQSVMASIWNWNFGDYLSGESNYSNMPSPSHYYTNEGNYTVTLIVETIYGCIDSTSAEINVNTNFTFYIPSSFTPDGDGLNDVFNAFGTNILEFEMYIFDRWGKLLFETQDHNLYWDGKPKNSDKICPQDVYVYKIYITDFRYKVHKYYGTVTLLR